MTAPAWKVAAALVALHQGHVHGPLAPQFLADWCTRPEPETKP